MTSKPTRSILRYSSVMNMEKGCHKPTRPILHYSSVTNMEKANFTNFENS